MTVIDEYLDKIDEPNQKELRRIRKIINTVVPEAEEVIDYGMPAFKYKGKYLIGFHVFKNHMSLFPTANPIKALEKKLNGFKISKGTIQFDSNNTIPEPTIRNLIIFRIDDIDREVEQKLQ